MMEFEGHRFHDRASLERALRESWPGVWVEPREGGDPLPFTWALRLGDQHPGWQGEIVTVLAELSLDVDGGIAFGAIESLRAAPWDVGPALARAAAGRLDAFAAHPSPRYDGTTGMTTLADVAELLNRSPAKDAMPPQLGPDLAGRRRPEDGFPATAYTALELADASGRTAAAEAIVDWIADLGVDAARVSSILAQGPASSERVAEALARRGLADAFAAIAKPQLEAAAASLEASLANADLPAVLKERMKARRGTHGARWASLARALGVQAGRFAA